MNRTGEGLFRRAHKEWLTPDAGGRKVRMTLMVHISYHMCKALLMRVLAFITILFSLSFSSALATSVVAVRDNNEIVIGADSKTILSSPKNDPVTAGSIERCKIVQAGNLFFASAGFAGVGPARFPGNIDRDFDLREIAAAALKVPGRISDRVSNLEKILVADLTRLAEQARQDDAGFFLTRFMGRPVYTIIVGGLEDGELVLMVRTFRPIVAASGSLSFQIGRFSCPGDCERPFVTVSEGQTAEIRKYIEQHKLFLHFAEPVTAVRELVELEISADPSLVGPPVDILRLTKRGAEWIQRKPLCPDIRKNMGLLEERMSKTADILFW